MNCASNGCKEAAEKDGLCNRHYHRKVWLDNSDINNLGILNFAQKIVPDWVRNETPDFHRRFFYKVFQLYKKTHVNKYDRLMAEIAFRGAAKTTDAKILLLYICCFGLEKFVVYGSETNTFAVQDIFEVRRELSSNPRIKYYFGILNSKRVKGQDGEWSRDAFMTSTGTCVLARGVGQQVRGVLRNSYRCTLAIINDMDSKNTVKTEYTRAEQQKWFFQELFNGVDDLEGKVIFNGTILHEDSVPVLLKNNSRWEVLETPVMDIDDFEKALKECVIEDNVVKLPSDERIAELEAESIMAWKSRLNLKYILTKYAESFENAQTDGFYQEYFNIVVPPTEKNFKLIKRAYMRYFRFRNLNWLAIKFGPEEKEIIYPVNIYLGVDPASSTTSSAKYSVIAILMMNQYRQVFYYGYSRGRFALRDEFKPGVVRADYDLVEFNETLIARKGIVDEEVRLAKKYYPNGSQIETTQAQQHIYVEIARIMRKNNANHSIYSDKPVTNKIDRDADMLLPDFQTGSAFINYGLDALEMEFKSFPRGTTIDVIDAFYHARCIARPSENAVYNEVSVSPPEKQELSTTFAVL